MEHNQDEFTPEKTDVAVPFFQKITSHISRYTMWVRAHITPMVAYTTLGVVALLIGITAVLGYVSYGSLPGNKLYPVKVHVAENAIALTKLTSDARVAWSLQQMEARLNELVYIERDIATTSPETLASFANIVDGQSTSAIKTIEKSSLALESKVDALARLSTLAHAQDTLADSAEELTSIADTLQGTRKNVDDALDAQITFFIDAGDQEAINSYLSFHIEKVSQELPQIANGSDAQRRAITQIQETLDAIAANDTKEAITSLLKTERAIAIDGYLLDEERGPVEGAAPLPVLEPQS